MPDLHPVQLEIYRNLFVSIAEEMGTVLKRTAYSPNIKERRDYSCAVFDGKGQVIAMGDHMPVHLGSMPLSVRMAIDRFRPRPGDIIMLNDPFAGGTHLPDITLIAPVFPPRSKPSRPMFYVAARAHHSDVGGMSPGSMPMSQEIFQEGLRIPPLKLYSGGKLDRGVLRFLLFNVRTPIEREGDLAAQVGSIKIGEKRLMELVERSGLKEVELYVEGLHDYADRAVRHLISQMPDGVYRAEDFLDDDGVDTSAKSSSVSIKVAIEIKGDRMKIDFTGSDSQVRGCLNAVYAITLSAVHYVLRCLASHEVPASGGMLRAVELIAPEGTIVNAQFPSATAGGNVETSQRIVDVLLKALAGALPDRIPAASSGTMNNLSIGGLLPGTGTPFSYYETVGGGMGAGPGSDGDSGIHTHMTNSLNTPIEALERYYPIRVREYRIRRGSGGKGQNRGGDGIVRSLEMLTDCQLTVLSERRRHAPYGMKGGTSGKKGQNLLQISAVKKKKLHGKVSMSLAKGEVITVETPGGGGWGRRR
ncbi:MAG: hydantoinase B/oxoprolinase family protein [Acidobacteriota bacterium]|nr:MAG: hydantoinase B/oxoprolinase family protein [Acidobacteriota bacterium]